MSSATPRKFSEKIAILNRKQNEDQAAFNDIIADVRQITQVGDPRPSTSKVCAPGGLPPWPRPGGSLPNVNDVAVDLGIEPGVGPWPEAGGMAYMESGSRVLHPSRGRSPGAHPHSHYHPYPRLHSPGERNVQFHHPTFPIPHSGPDYLQPPSDPGWRRTHSDPLLHQHVSIPGSTASTNTSPQIQTPPGGSPNADTTQGASSVYLEPKGLGESGQPRPQSCETFQNVPNISITGSEVPISNSTGSLPNLPSKLAPAPGPPLDPNCVVGADDVWPSYGVSPYGGVPTQQRHSIQLPVQIPPLPYMQLNSSPHGSPNIYAHGPGPPLFAMEPCPQSQSAPNSPASSMTAGGESPVPSPGTLAYNAVNSQFQGLGLHTTQDGGDSSPGRWYAMPQSGYPNFGGAYYSPQGDNGAQIPEITFTGAEDVGGAVPTSYESNLEFADIQINYADIREIQRLLENDQVVTDPGSEDAFRHERN